MPKRRDYTFNDIAVLKAAIELLARQPYPPTLREVGFATDLAYGSVQKALKRLQVFGLVDMTPGIKRSLRILPRAKTALREYAAHPGAKH